VLEKIAEVEELDGNGDCWCQCVKDDIPKAKGLALKGLCLGAMKVIKAARARCTSPEEKEADAASRGEFGAIVPIAIEPIRPLKLETNKPFQIQGVVAVGPVER
jgi:hypothetical protein